MDAEIVEDEEESTDLVPSDKGNLSYTWAYIPGIANAIAISTLVLEILLVLGVIAALFLGGEGTLSAMPRWAAFLVLCFAAGAGVRLLRESGRLFHVLYERWVKYWPERQEWAASAIASAPWAQRQLPPAATPTASQEYQDMAVKIDEEHNENGPPSGI